MNIPHQFLSKLIEVSKEKNIEIHNLGVLFCIENKADGHIFIVQDITDKKQPVEITRFKPKNIFWQEDICNLVADENIKLKKERDLVLNNILADYTKQLEDAKTESEKQVIKAQIETLSEIEKQLNYFIEANERHEMWLVNTCQKDFEEMIVMLPKMVKRAKELLKLSTFQTDFDIRNTLKEIATFLDLKNRNDGYETYNNVFKIGRYREFRNFLNILENKIK